MSSVSGKELWAKMRRMLRHGTLGIQVMLLRDLEKRRKAVVDAVAAGAVVLTDAEGKATTEIVKQGDLSLYTEEALRERYGMSHNVKLVDAINRHFTALTAHKAPGSKFVSKDQYLRYFLLAYRTLYPDSGMSVEEQCKALEGEWENDRRGHEAMNSHDFFLAVFELVDQWCPTVVVDDYLNMLDELYAQVLTRHWDIEEEETTQSRRASRNLSVSTRGRTQGSMGSTGPDGLFGRGSMDQPSALTDMLEEEETPLFGDSVDAAFPFPSPGSVDPHASMVTHNSVLQSQQPSVPSSLEPSLVQESQQHSVLDPLPAYGHEQASLASEGGALVETAAPTRQRRKATAEVSGEGVAGGMADGSVELASASLQEGLPLTAAQRSAAAARKAGSKDAGQGKGGKATGDLEVKAVPGRSSAVPPSASVDISDPYVDPGAMTPRTRARHTGRLNYGQPGWATIDGGLGSAFPPSNNGAAAGKCGACAMTPPGGTCTMCGSRPAPSLLITQMASVDMTDDLLFNAFRTSKPPPLRLKPRPIEVPPRPAEPTQPPQPASPSRPAEVDILFSTAKALVRSPAAAKAPQRSPARSPGRTVASGRSPGITESAGRTPGLTASAMWCTGSLPSPSRRLPRNLISLQVLHSSVATAGGQQPPPLSTAALAAVPSPTFAQVKARPVTIITPSSSRAPSSPLTQYATVSPSPKPSNATLHGVEVRYLASFDNTEDARLSQSLRPRSGAMKSPKRAPSPSPRLSASLPPWAAAAESQFGPEVTPISARFDGPSSSRPATRRLPVQQAW